MTSALPDNSNCFAADTRDIRFDQDAELGRTIMEYTLPLYRKTYSAYRGLGGGGGAGYYNKTHISLLLSSVLIRNYNKL
jgi:hypothetical protein